MTLEGLAVICLVNSGMRLASTALTGETFSFLLSIHTDISVFPVLGTVLSHGFLVSNFLPLRIVFPTLAAVLLGPTVLIPDSILVDTFADYLSTYESAFIRDMVIHVRDKKPSSFNREQSKMLTDIFSRMDCRELPKPGNLERLIIQVARHEFITKRLGALYGMNGGVPAPYHSLWKGVGVGELYNWYKALSASPKRVLEKIEEIDPDFMSVAENRVFNFLIQFIGDLTQEELRNFLCYVTGSSVLL